MSGKASAEIWNFRNKFPGEFARDFLVDFLVDFSGKKQKGKIHPKIHSKIQITLQGSGLEEMLVFLRKRSGTKVQKIKNYGHGKILRIPEP